MNSCELEKNANRSPTAERLWGRASLSMTIEKLGSGRMCTRDPQCASLGLRAGYCL